MAELARGLRNQGLVVHEDVGASADPVDLAVEDPHRPGHLLLAVESDGPAYAALRSARDRDRLRAEHLTRLGWRHVRVWSSDIFRDPAHDIARIVTAAEGREVQPDEAEQGEAGEARTTPDAAEAAGELGRLAVGSSPRAGAVDQTRDDTDAGWGEYSDRGAHDRWLQEQRPPHWE
jgi:hypothetical protein